MFLVIWPNCVAAQETFAWLASKPRFWCPSMQIIYKDFANGSHPSPFPPRFARFRGRSQTTLTRFWVFLTTYPPVLTFSMVWKLTKSGHFWTTYLPRLVNVVCERPQTPLPLEIHIHKPDFLERHIKIKSYQPFWCWNFLITHEFGQIFSSVALKLCCSLKSSGYQTEKIIFMA